MNLEGKVMGYDKKTVAIVVAVLLALVIFYAGTRYEKMRINSAVKKQNQSQAPKKDKTKVAPAPVAQPAEVAPAATPAPTTTPATTTPAPKAAAPVAPVKK